MSQLTITDKYAHPAVVAYWRELAQAGLQASEWEMLRRYAPAPARLLDLGCGSGRAGLALTPHGYTVTGLDITWEMVQAAQQLLAKTAVSPQLLQADLTQIPAASQSYDVALIFIAALQHIAGQQARRAALAEINRVLAPGGKLILALDNIAPALTCYIWWGWRKLFGTIQVDAEARLYQRQHQQQTAADAMIASRRQQVSRWEWYGRGLLRTLRWRTLPGLIDHGRRFGWLPGTVGDTNVAQFSLPITEGTVYYHLYRHEALLADAAAAGFILLGYHSGNELTEAQFFSPTVRRLDKQVLYAFGKR